MSGSASVRFVWGFGALLCTVAARADDQPVVVNECAVGPSGWVELFNRSAQTRELAKDPSACWSVDDADGGGPSKLIDDAAVHHASASTVCSEVGRGARCGLIGPGEHVWVPYAYLNGMTADRCRFVRAARSGKRCASETEELSVSGATAGSGSGHCYGRAPDGAGWSSAAIACTQGMPNAACQVGAACDDGNPCTIGETYSQTCTCSAGTPASGASCGGDRTCQAGVCSPLSASAAPEIVKHGSDGLLLAGTIMTPGGAIEGEVLVVQDRIRCVAASCQSDPAALTATVVQTNGIVYPGLIDTHNHIQFDVFDESDWSPEATDHFTNHNQWPSRARYKALVDTKQYLNGESGSPVKIGCELLKYGELKALVAGTTAVIGAPIPANQACFGSLLRSIDQRANGLATDKVQTATPFPSRESADSVCKNIADSKTDAYLIHIAEGVDETAHAEFAKLASITSQAGCLLNPKTTIVHGTALDELDFGTMAAHGMGLVWSPRSNVFLYGHGTDLSKTANIPAALEHGLTVALAPDWSIGGSQNLLDELRFADHVDNAQWGDAIAPRQLAAMVTGNPATLLGLGNTLGSLAPGYAADVMVLAGDRSAPYDALLKATPKDVRLVLVGGTALYGDSLLQALASRPSECEPLALCGASKFMCVTAPGATAANKFGQSYAQIRKIIESELEKYDAKDLSTWNFAPVAELYRCPPEPVRPGEPVVLSVGRR